MNLRNNLYKAHGNMTRAEKKMNKEILDAYKKYDYAPVAMVPGLSPIKALPQGQSETKTKEPFELSKAKEGLMSPERAADYEKYMQG